VTEKTSALSPRDDEQTIERLLRAAGPRATADELRQARVRAIVHDAWRGELHRRARRQWLWIGGVGLAAAAAVLLTAVLPWRPPTPATPVVVARFVSASGPLALESTVLMAGTRLETGDTTRATFSLEAGGELRLDVNTAVLLQGDRRLTLQRGALYFDSRDPAIDRPLVIDTPLGLVRDVGTRFEVRLSGQDVIVRVRDGVVALERGQDQRTAGAGTELHARADGRVEQQPFSAADTAWDWTVIAGPPFKVEGARLDAFLAWASREGGLAIEFADRDLQRRMAGTILHGSVEGLTVAEALSVVLPTCGLRHAASPGRIFITRPDPSGGTQ